MKDEQAELDGLADRLRARVAEGRYPEAQDALAEYCRALRKTAVGLPPGDPGLRRLEDDWLRLWEETRRRALAGRAHDGMRLAHLPKLPPIYGDYPQPRRTRQCFA